MVEILVVLAGIGVLAALTIPLLRQPAARLFATDVRAQIQQARYEAIKRNVPVAVVYDPALERFETRLDPAATSYDDACQASATPTVKAVSDYRNVQVTSPATFGVVWLPSGLGRGCTGMTLANISITDGRTSRTVTISTAGSVTVQ